MLEQLLAEIHKADTTSPLVLAKRLNTTPAMVQAMLETLEQQGYLRSIDPGCDAEKTCESCALSGMCSTKNARNPKILVLKEH